MSSNGNIRLVFWGTSNFAVPLLRALAADQRFEIVAVVTRPNEPTGRSQAPTPTPVNSAALELGLRILQPKTLKDTTWTANYAELLPDVAVVAAYGKLIPQEILDIPKHKTLNVHPSLLPKYRGPSPIQAAIVSGDKETGVTIMLLDSEMDHGPILKQQIVPLTGAETAPELESRLVDTATTMLPDSIAGYVAGELTLIEQNHPLATFTHLITREDGRVDWNLSSAEIERLWRAYQPWPGLWTKWRRKGRAQRFKILELTIADGTAPAAPGTVIKSKHDLVVICRTDAIRVSRLQPDGKKPMSAEEFLSGHQEIIGSVID